MSMIPGVTYLPRPSIVRTASAGAAMFAPTATILPLRIRIDPLRIAGPAAVKIVAFRISVACDGNRTYVDGYGSANGSETAPGPGVGPGAADGAGDGTLCCARLGGGSAMKAAMKTAASTRTGRIIRPDLLGDARG